MSRNRGIRILLPFICLLFSISTASNVRPISDSHRNAALELFMPVDESFESLENSYEALRTLEILGLRKSYDVSSTTCKAVLEKLESSSSTIKNLFYALKVNDILECNVKAIEFEEIALKLLAGLKTTSSLPDFYHSIGSLLLIKKKGFEANLPDSAGAIHFIKTLSQSDGRWRYDLNSSESSAHATGMALEAFAGVVLLSNSEINQSTIEVVKIDIIKLFDRIKSYNDGTLYVDDKHGQTVNYRSPLEISASVVRGVIALAEVSSKRLNIPGDKMLGLAKFFLSIGVPGTPRDLFYQIESLSYLENNRIYIPLIISLPTSVISLSSKDQLKVDVTTVFGAATPPLSVKLVHGLNSNSDGEAIIENQDLYFDKENYIHYLDIPLLKVDVGKYNLIFEASLHHPEDANKYTIGGQIGFSVIFIGSIKIDKAEIAILNSDAVSVETIERLDLTKDNFLSLSANHLQKLRLSFQLTTPYGRTFKPHQAFLKLRHETKVEHIFVINSSARQYKLILDFLGLVDKLYYLSGKYDMELAVGDATMENSFLRSLGIVDLDLPEPPEKAAQPPQLPADPYLTHKPKEEIIHIFRVPEKRPPKELSLVFLALSFLPLLGFIIGLIRFRVNLKAFSSSLVPAAFSILFHAGIAAVLLLYGLFWFKLDLFTTLKALCFLGPFLVFVGHRTLAHLSSTSAKLKSS